MWGWRRSTLRYSIKAFSSPPVRPAGVGGRGRPGRIRVAFQPPRASSGRQLQQTPQLTQQPGVSLWGEVAGIRAREGQHAELPEPHQGHQATSTSLPNSACFSLWLRRPEIVVRAGQALPCSCSELFARPGNAARGRSAGNAWDWPEPQAGESQPPLDEGLAITALSSEQGLAA